MRLRPGESVPADRPTLMIFTDFQCPACRCNAAAVQNQVAEAFKGNANILIRHFPLNKDCNLTVKTTLHSNACEAAFAAEAARLLGGEQAFTQMHDLLFQNTNRLGQDLYRNLAIQAGLDPDRFADAMDDEVVRKIIADDIRLGTQLNVQGYTHPVLDGRRIPKLCQGEVFWNAVAASWKNKRDSSLAAASEDHPQQSGHYETQIKPVICVR